MAIQAEISFKVFESGKRIASVRKTTLVNSWQEVIDKVREQARKEYPEIDDITIHFNEQNQTYGIGIIIGTANNKLFKLEVNRL